MGSVVLAPDGEPVIQTPHGLQYNGYFVASLADLDRGRYTIYSGEPVDFDTYWDGIDAGRTWAELVEGRP